MKTEEFMKRFVILLAQEQEENPLGWHYLSFAGESGFLGGVVLQAHGILDAVDRCTKQGINPGGEVMEVPIRDEATLPAEEHRNRLLSKAELETIFSDLINLAERNI